MTTPKTRDMVWSAYRNGQEIDKRPSMAYLVVQTMAVAEVALKEGLITEDGAFTMVTAELVLVRKHLEPSDTKLLSRYLPGMV